MRKVQSQFGGFGIKKAEDDLYDHVQDPNVMNDDPMGGEDFPPSPETPAGLFDGKSIYTADDPLGSGLPANTRHAITKAFESGQADFVSVEYTGMAIITNVYKKVNTFRETTD